MPYRQARERCAFAFSRLCPNFANVLAQDDFDSTARGQAIAKQKVLGNTVCSISKITLGIVTDMYNNSLAHVPDHLHTVPTGSKQNTQKGLCSCVSIRLLNKESALVGSRLPATDLAAATTPSGV